MQVMPCVFANWMQSTLSVAVPDAHPRIDARFMTSGTVKEIRSLSRLQSVGES